MDKLNIFKNGVYYKVKQDWEDDPPAKYIIRIKSLCYSVKVGDILKFRGPNLGHAEFITKDGKLLILSKSIAFRIFENV